MPPPFSFIGPEETIDGGSTKLAHLIGCLRCYLEFSMLMENPYEAVSEVRDLVNETVLGVP